MKKHIQQLIPFMLIVCLIASGCGYYPTSENNNNDQSWNDEWDGEYDGEDQDDWNDVWKDDEEDEEETDDEIPGQQLDGWSFANYDLDNKVGINGYYISESDYQRLIGNLTETERNWVKYSMSKPDESAYTNYNVGGSGKKPVEWKGSCYGMSLTAALANRKILSPGDLHASSHLNSTALSRENLSAINFYHWQQKLAISRLARVQFQTLEATQQVDRMVEVAQTGKPFEIDFYWQESLSEDAKVHGHSVVGYGITYGNWSWVRNGYSKEYDAKIEVYDCNYPESSCGENDESEDWDIYVNTADGSWCNPAHKIMSLTNGVTDQTTDNGKLGAVRADDGFLNAIDYRTGMLSDAYLQEMRQESFATVQADSGQCMNIESTSGKASVHGLVVENSTYGNALKTAATTYGFSSQVQIYLPQGESDYQISSDKDLNFIFDVGNMLVSVQADSPGMFALHEDGTIEVSCIEEPKNCEVSITSDDKDAFGIDNCPTIKIENSGSQNLKISQSLQGLTIDGDDLSDLTVNGEMYGEVTSIKANTEGEAVLLSHFGNQVKVSADTTGDGAYETVISKTEIPKEKVKISLKDKSVTYSGKTQNISKAIVEGTDSNNLIYVYYKDKKCTEEIQNHKNAGVYYVKAYILNECGTFYESNVAKLTIKKAAQSIKLKTKSFQLKASVLKNTSKTTTLKATAKGKVTFKKISGNAKIKISSSGKVTVAKGLKKGTYKVKVKLTAKEKENWKKKSKTVYVRLKVK